MAQGSLGVANETDRTIFHTDQQGRFLALLGGLLFACIVVIVWIGPRDCRVWCCGGRGPHGGIHLGMLSRGGVFSYIAGSVLFCSLGTVRILLRG